MTACDTEHVTLEHVPRCFDPPTSKEEKEKKDKEKMPSPQHAPVAVCRWQEPAPPPPFLSGTPVYTLGNSHGAVRIAASVAGGMEGMWPGARLVSIPTPQLEFR